jgi:hypothetical protein
MSRFHKLGSNPSLLSEGVFIIHATTSTAIQPLKYHSMIFFRIPSFMSLNNLLCISVCNCCLIDCLFDMILNIRWGFALQTVAKFWQKNPLNKTMTNKPSTVLIPNHIHYRTRHFLQNQTPSLLYHFISKITHSTLHSSWSNKINVISKFFVFFSNNC